MSSNLKAEIELLDKYAKEVTDKNSDLVNELSELLNAFALNIKKLPTHYQFIFDHYYLKTGSSKIYEMWADAEYSYYHYELPYSVQRKIYDKLESVIINIKNAINNNMFLRADDLY